MFSIVLVKAMNHLQISIVMQPWTSRLHQSLYHPHHHRNLHHQDLLSVWGLSLAIHCCQPLLFLFLFAIDPHHLTIFTQHPHLIIPSPLFVWRLMANSRMAMSQMQPYKLSAPSSVLSSKNLNAWMANKVTCHKRLEGSMRGYLGIVGLLTELGKHNSLHQSTEFPGNIIKIGKTPRD